MDTEKTTLDRDGALDDLRFIREALARTERLIDPHAFHFVWWGALLLLWYPLANYLEVAGNHDLAVKLHIGFPILGGIGSAVLGARRGRQVVDGENTHIAMQVLLVVIGSMVATGIVSVAGVTSGFIDQRQLFTLWALGYAAMAFGVGVIYRSEFLWAAVGIFATAVAAMYLPDYAGFLVGPGMGLGMVVPGWMAEKRVRGHRRPARAGEGTED